MDMAYGRDTVYVDIVSNKGPSLVDAPSSYQHVFDQVRRVRVGGQSGHAQRMCARAC